MTSNIYFITYATHSERLFDLLLESATRNNIKLNVIGMGDKWIGWKKRAEYILNHLENLDDNMIVCHIDGFDSIILSNAEEIYNKFINYYNNKKVVFSSDDSANFLVKYFKLKKFNLCRNHFISAGLYIGYNYYIQHLLKMFINSDHTDDQRFFTLLCDDPNMSDIGIDSDNILFYNYQYFDTSNLNYYNNRLYFKNSDPCIISAPGNINITNILSNFNYKYVQKNNKAGINYIFRNLTGTISFFYVEIMFLISIIFCLYKIIF